MNFQGKIQRFEEMIDDSARICFFGGAGVSTESGLPDFRSDDGIYKRAKKQYQASPETILSVAYREHHPKAYWTFIEEELMHPDVKPGLAHHYLVELEESGKDVRIVTQNIDNLHEEAGSKHVYAIHGNQYHFTCLAHGHHFTYDDATFDDLKRPICPYCHRLAQDDIILYGQQLNEAVVIDAIDAIKHADLLIIAGTSLNVYPAASFIDYFNGKYQVVINRDPLPVPKRQETLTFWQNIGEVFGALR